METNPGNRRTDKAQLLAEAQPACANAKQHTRNMDGRRSRRNQQPINANEAAAHLLPLKDQISAVSRVLNNKLVINQQQASRRPKRPRRWIGI